MHECKVIFISPPPSIVPQATTVFLDVNPATWNRFSFRSSSPRTPTAQTQRPQRALVCYRIHRAKFSRPSSRTSNVVRWLNSAGGPGGVWRRDNTMRCRCKIVNVASFVRFAGIIASLHRP